MIRPRALVFAGAGASCAVSLNKYPTTAGFYKRLPSDVVADSLLSTLGSNFARKFGDGAPDIEKLLWCVEELIGYLEAVADPKHPASWVLSHGILPKLLGSDQGVGSFAQVASRGANHLRRLRDRINASLYDVYGETPEASEIDQNWAPLVRGLLGKNYWVDFFTTNYDLVLEAVVDASGRDVGYGQGPGAVRQLDLEVWRKSLLDEAFRPYQDGLITKLHGSLNWERDRRGVVFGGPTFKSSHDHHVAIYPGFKGAPTAEPFSLMHDYFERALQSADLLIFIGFAFRDEYLNTLISRAPLSKKKKFVIDPADALGGPFQLQGGVSHHKGVFDLRSVEWLLAKV